MPVWPFKRSQADLDAERLLAAVTQASRQPALFGEGRIPDTLEGRFELLTLNASLALIRLRAATGAETLAQCFTDKLFRHFDAGLREDGVGDLIVPKKMHKLAGSFYGRLDAYAAALGGSDSEALAAAVGRNVLGDATHPFAATLAAYVRSVSGRQGQSALDALFSMQGWPAHQA